MGEQNIAALWEHKLMVSLTKNEDAVGKEFLARVVDGLDTAIRTVTVMEVLDIVKKLPVNKAVGLDDILGGSVKNIPH